MRNRFLHIFVNCPSIEEGEALYLELKNRGYQVSKTDPKARGYISERLKDQILESMRIHDVWSSSDFKDWLEKHKYSRGSMSVAIAGLVERGHITRIKRGVYVRVK